MKETEAVTALLLLLTTLVTPTWESIPPDAVALRVCYSTDPWEARHCSGHDGGWVTVSVEDPTFSLPDPAPGEVFYWTLASVRADGCVGET